MKIVDRNFFNQRAVELAPKLLGKILCRKINGEIRKSKIIEVEAYTGIEDTACHSSKNKTARNSVMWEDGGTIYVYLCYGLHYLFNIVCGGGNPEAVLIRGVENAKGPGNVTKYFDFDKSFNNVDIINSKEIWLEEGEIPKNIKTSRRIGIDYAQPKDRDALLRFYLD